MSSEKNGNISAQVDSRLDDLFGDGDEQSENFENKETEAEVNDRIDDIFGDSGSNDSGANESPIELDNPNKMKSDQKSDQKKSKTPQRSSRHAAQPEENSPIQDLKSVILSLEWEISDQVMQRLGEEVLKLEGEYKDDKIVVAFLQLLGSLGKYIQKKRAEAHPDSISLLNSVYENLEQVIMSDELTDSAKKKMLVTEVNKYKKLKEHIASIKSSVPRKKEYKPAGKPPQEYEPEPVEAPETVAGGEEESSVSGAPESYTGISADEHSEQQLIIKTLQEINQTIKSEFQALREELHSWKNS